MAQKHIEDHSVYQGHGRYGKNATAPKDIINAQFEINPTRNRGLDYQYDEVVRGQKDRKWMDAGDCECCRDYYEAVGPLPKRLQAPHTQVASNTSFPDSDSQVKDERVHNSFSVMGLHGNSLGR
ncbi:hypothetical protein C0995_005848 [Termitomyces sp. Mi166|nr:hypothetical protein C0995_005848 [Termitomyces sp. Mi166\